MKRLFFVAGLFVLTSCTSNQIAKWQDWFSQDPTAAIEFANRPEIQEQLNSSQQESQVQNSVWDDLAQCESGQNWSYNGSSGYDGGIQFHPRTWRAYGGEEFASYAWAASREQQIIVGERVLDDVGWGAWPACSRKLGLR